MNKLRPLVESHLMEMSLYEILHSLHVVIRGFLDFLHLHSLFRREIQIDVTHHAELFMIHVSELRQRYFAKRDKILDLHTDTVSYKGKFAEIRPERFRFGSVAAVYWRHSQQ